MRDVPLLFELVIVSSYLRGKPYKMQLDACFVVAIRTATSIWYIIIYSALGPDETQTFMGALLKSYPL